jgi:hypothetical protein
MITLVPRLLVLALVAAAWTQLGCGRTKGCDSLERLACAHGVKVCTPEGWICSGDAGADDGPPDVAETNAPETNVAETNADIREREGEVAPTPIDGARCGHANPGSATVVVHQPDGSELSCTHCIDAGTGGATTIVWTGMVTGSDATSVTVEACGGAADGGCVPGALRVEAKAPGLDLTSSPRSRSA